MKWDNKSNSAAERVNGFFAKFVTSRAFFVLVALTSLVLIASASNKFD